MDCEKLELTEEQVEQIASKVALKLGEAAASAAIKQMRNEAYTSVGRGALRILGWMASMLIIALFFYAVSHGYIKN